MLERNRLLQAAKNLGVLQPGTPVALKGTIDRNDRVDWFQFRVEPSLKRGSSAHLSAFGINRCSCPVCSGNSSGAGIVAKVFQADDRDQPGRSLGRLDARSIQVSSGLYYIKVKLKPGAQQVVKYNFILAESNSAAGFQPDAADRFTSSSLANNKSSDSKKLSSKLSSITSKSSTRKNDAGPEQFTPSSLAVNADYLYDLGVVDANNDNYFDIFTTNHNSRQSILAGSSSGQFRDVLTEWRLDQDHEFPGLENFQFTPAASSQGLYIYRSNVRELHLQLKQAPGIKPVTGTIVFPSPGSKQASVKVVKKQRAKASISDRSWDQGLKTTIQFKLRPNGHLVLNTRFPEVSYAVKLDKSLPLNQVHVGAQALHPRRRKFTLRWQDRHGMAWVDYQGDDRMDVFITRGGLRGQILNFPDSADIHDELFVNQGQEQFQDKATKLGFAKQGTRARKVSWVDFDQDNRLDLYIEGKNSPNQLFRQTPNGRFKNIAPRLGLNFEDSDLFEWLDADSDSDQDLLVARQGKLELYSNQIKGKQSGGRPVRQFKRRWSMPIAGAPLEKFAIADYDRDGDLDVYVAAPTSSTLLVNTGGQFSAVNPVSIGLPTQGLTANWVDYDNDGLLDLHVLPGLLYRQQPSGQFVATQFLSDFLPSAAISSIDPAIVSIRATWFDLDNNGTRDALCFAPWQTTLFHNRFQQNHWLQVKLVGVAGNRQAIGAKVIIETTSGQQLQQVGGAEGSHYSQGHYRLYFGLGQSQTVRSLRIIWPDGRQQQISTPATDRLLTVTYPATLDQK